MTVFIVRTLPVCSVWVGNKVAKLYTMQKSRWYSAAFALRQRMLNFVQNFEYYMMFEVIEPNWHLFQHNMDTVRGLLLEMAFQFLCWWSAKLDGNIYIIICIYILCK